MILKKIFKNSTLAGYSDTYPVKEEVIEIPYDRDSINSLIGREYEETQVKEILSLLGIEVKNKKCIIPFWRKDMKRKADIAEEICRIDGYDKVLPTTPRIDV